MSPPAPTFLASAAKFRTWLARHGTKRNELIVGFWKIGSGKPSMTWPESVDEALCFGWIDGVRKRIDDESYLIRFTPRKRGSTWSAVNLAKVRALTQAGRMQPSGLAAFAARSEARTAIYSYEQRNHPELTDAEARRFKTNQAAWAFFGSCPPSYRKLALYRVVSAKKAETRKRRLALLIEACGRNERLPG